MQSASWAAWAWIPISIWGALAQTARNAAQRSLVAQGGALGATLARFLYGLPFAALWLAALHAVPATGGAIPHFGPRYFGWQLLGAVGQLAATAFMLVAIKQRNFVVGVAFSKTDALQVALLGAFFLHELPGWITMAAIAVATNAFAGAWRALLALSRGLRRGMALFEQRYYLAGLLIAVILVIMLFIQ